MTYWPNIAVEPSRRSCKKRAVKGVKISQSSKQDVSTKYVDNTTDRPTFSITVFIANITRSVGYFRARAWGGNSPIFSDTVLPR